MKNLQLKWETLISTTTADKYTGGEINITERVSFNGYDKGRSIALVVREEEYTGYVGWPCHVFWEAYVVEVTTDNTKTKIMALHPRARISDRTRMEDDIQTAMEVAEDWYFANAIALAGLVLR